MSDLKQRTEDFGLRIINMFRDLPKETDAQVLGKKALQCGTSAGANYRESARSGSRIEFIGRLESAIQELDETQYWLNLLVRSEIVKAERMEGLFKEINELLSILVSSVKTAKKNLEEEKK